MICSRNYKTYGPYGLQPFGEKRNATRFRVIDARGRRISEPMARREAVRLCRLLNEVFDNALSVRVLLTFQRTK